MNKVFKKHKNRTWTWKSPNGETKNEIDFIMYQQPGMIQDTQVVGKIKCSDYRLVRAKIVLNLKKTRTKLFIRKSGNLEVIRAKNEECKVTLSNKFKALGQNDDELEEINKTITKTIIETAIEIGGKATKQATSKLSQSTKDLINKRQQMKVTSSKENIELAELSKLTSKARQRDVRNLKMREIKKAV